MLNDDTVPVSPRDISAISNWNRLVFIPIPADEPARKFLNVYWAVISNRRVEVPHLRKRCFVTLNSPPRRKTHSFLYAWYKSAQIIRGRCSRCLEIPIIVFLGSGS